MTKGRNVFTERKAPLPFFLFTTVVRLDREYIENWSLKQDIHILFRTVWVVLTRRGAM